jgi:6-phosphofructo-2-kinase/fructose-2,6-biphosphatase 4
LKWLGVKCGVFSLGDYRRKVLGGADKVPPDYFKPGEKSQETEALRAKILAELDQQVIDFFMKEGGQVIIYDANNGTQKRRADIREKFGAMGVHVMFLGKEIVWTEKPRTLHQSRLTHLLPFFGWQRVYALIRR